MTGPASVRKAISERCRVNLAELRRRAADRPEASIGPIGGGWSAILRVPNVVDEEELCLDLLERGVAVHPGSFFGFTDEGWLVLSLLPPVSLFANGTRILFDVLTEALTSHSG